jgi:hypothetical protein
MCRFLTAGDVDGDGRLEMVATARRSGLWLLRRPKDPATEWTLESIDRNSSGFEHAAILTDLDGDGTEELYVANDDKSELNQYVWRDGVPGKITIYRHPADTSVFTWNIMPAPAEALP